MVLMVSLDKLLDEPQGYFKIIRIPEDLPWVPYQREEQEQPYLRLPIPDYEPREPPYEKKEEERGVVIIDI